MVPLGNLDDEVQPAKKNSILDHSDTETQPFDSPSSTPTKSGKNFKDQGVDELQFGQSTLPVFDTIPLEDAFETQVMDLAVETQVLDNPEGVAIVDEADFGTQVMNLAGETQVMDDPDGVGIMGTQLLDMFDDEVGDSDNEGTDGTEVLGDTEELSDDDSAERLGSYPVDQENKLCTTMSIQESFKAELDGLTDEQRSSGSVRGNFTSVRAGDSRVSGLEASSMAVKLNNSEPSFIESDGLSSKQHTAEDNGITLTRDSSSFGEEGGKKDFVGDYDEQVKEVRTGDKCMVGSSTVRRLFMNDAFAEIQGPYNNYTNNADGGEDMPSLPGCCNEMAGLSYVDSQDPGEASQANALGFVDKFLKVSVMEFDQELDIGRSTGGKSKLVSSTKGIQSLAKKTNIKVTAGERGIFDWDDCLEDEGGGEFFTKKKGAFFDNEGQRQRCLTQPKKLRHRESKRSSAVDETIDKKQRLDIAQKVKGLVNSDPGLLLPNSKGNEKKSNLTEIKSKKNLNKELDEQFEVCSSDGAEPTGIDKAMPEGLDVGFDTQTAAEAMEALRFGSNVADHDNSDIVQDTGNMHEGSSGGGKKRRAQSKKYFLRKRSSSPSFGVLTRNSKQTKSIGTKSSKESTVFSRKQQAKNVTRQYGTELVKAELKKPMSNRKGCSATNDNENIDKVPSEFIALGEENRALERNDTDKVDRSHVISSSKVCASAKKRRMQEQIGAFTPIARRTRQRRLSNQLSSRTTSYDSREGIHLAEAIALNDRIEGGSTGRDAFTMKSSKEKLPRSNPNQFGEPDFGNLTAQDKSHQKATDAISAVKVGELSYNRGRRTDRKLSGQVNGSCNLRGLANQLVGQETNGQSLRKSSRSKTNAVTPFAMMDLGKRKKTLSSARAAPVLPFTDRQYDGGLFQQSADKGCSGGDALRCYSAGRNEVPKDVIALASKRPNRQNDVDTMSAGAGAGGNARSEMSPDGRCKPSGSASVTPSKMTTPKCTASPICMGDEYLKQSCRKNLSRSLLIKEINSLASNGLEPTSTTKYLRRRRDMANVRVLFSHHLDEDIAKQQKKISSRLGASVASSISEATHFVTDRFVRTRNMLEAIASGKPVVTHLWLESCGQASCFIDERNYILRDSKKEKEFGFSLPVSLAHACQRPLLQGLKVLITPNTKPGKDILVSLVKAVHGLAVERIGRSALKGDKFPEDMLVLSCEEDFAICVPYLEKGAVVYSSELLLNGIVTQKLEFDRHRLFEDHVKRTRSTIWLKQNSNRYQPVAKCK